jgi:hypothetical protein
MHPLTGASTGTRIRILKTIATTIAELLTKLALHGITSFGSLNIPGTLGIRTRFPTLLGCEVCVLLVVFSPNLGWVLIWFRLVMKRHKVLASSTSNLFTLQTHSHGPIHLMNLNKGTTPLLSTVSRISRRPLLPFLCHVHQHVILEVHLDVPEIEAVTLAAAGGEVVLVLEDGDEVGVQALTAPDMTAFEVDGFGGSWGVHAGATLGRFVGGVGTVHLDKVVGARDWWACRSYRGGGRSDEGSSSGVGGGSVVCRFVIVDFLVDLVVFVVTIRLVFVLDSGGGRIDGTVITTGGLRGVAKEFTKESVGTSESSLKRRQGLLNSGSGVPKVFVEGRSVHTGNDSQLSIQSKKAFIEGLELIVSRNRLVLNLIDVVLKAWKGLTKVVSLRRDRENAACGVWVSRLNLRDVFSWDLVFNDTKTPSWNCSHLRSGLWS